MKLTQKDLRRLKEKVRLRDGRKCILCGDQTKIVHEINFKSHGSKRSSKIFKEENMVCLCNDCHHSLHFEGNKKEYTQLIRTALIRRFNYKYDS